MRFFRWLRDLICSPAKAEAVPVTKPHGGYRLSKKSKERLVGVHPDLVRVIERAILITKVDFTVLEGVRSLDRQRVLVESGASKTINSRHLTGHAVDIAPYIQGRVELQHWPAFHELAPYIRQAAKDVNVSIEWGGSWVNFPDGAHWQLPWDKYPA